MEQEQPPVSAKFTITIDGAPKDYEYTQADFTKFGLAANDPLNTVGVFCPDDRNAPIMIADQAPPVYAQWATVHEQMCQRDANSTPCNEVEVTVLDLMRENGISEADIVQFVRKRIQMFDQLIQMNGGDSKQEKQAREMFSLSKKALENSLTEIEK